MKEQGARFLRQLRPARGGGTALLGARGVLPLALGTEPFVPLLLGHRQHRLGALAS